MRAFNVILDVYGLYGLAIRMIEWKFCLMAYGQFAKNLLHLYPKYDIYGVCYFPLLRHKYFNYLYLFVTLLNF